MADALWIRGAWVRHEVKPIPWISFVKKCFPFSVCNYYVRWITFVFSEIRSDEAGRKEQAAAVTHVICCLKWVPSCNRGRVCHDVYPHNARGHSKQNVLLVLPSLNVPRF